MSHDEYFDEFLLELRKREISGRVVTNHLAEALAHTADTGGDPSIEFGPPEEFAEELAGAVQWSKRIRRMMKISMAWLVAGAFGYFAQRSIRGLDSVLYFNYLVGVPVMAVSGLAAMAVVLTGAASWAGDDAAARMIMLKAFVPYAAGNLLGIGLMEEWLRRIALFDVPFWVAAVGTLIFGGWATFATEQDRRRAKLTPAALPVQLSVPFSRWTGASGFRTVFRLLRNHR